MSSLPSSPLADRTPVTHGEVRRRIESTESVEAEIKWLKTCATDICRTNRLPNDTLDQFATKTEKEMLLNVMGHLIALDKQKARDDACELVNLVEFKQSLTDRLCVTNWDGVTSNSEKMQAVCWEVLQCPEEDKVKVQGTHSEYYQGFCLKDKSKRFFENRD
ncbi:hypothetical protein BDR07DRAFT_1478688 [Suillus spraguei]|nr:hypothetical protein BDR07DRAFT_1478688 [Suillus spraguei]